MRPQPSNKLRQAEQAKIIEVCNMAKFANLPPSQIVPTLLDEDKYYVSESTFYRVLKAFGQLHHRGWRLAPRGSTLPTTYTATEPAQVFCWDITYLPSTVRGQFYYLYMLEDLFSRKIVSSEVHEQESGENAAQLLEQTQIREKCLHSGVVLHSVNGTPMKSQTMRMKAYELGVTT